jgi:hypothetical protein
MPDDEQESIPDKPADAADTPSDEDGPRQVDHAGSNAPEASESHGAENPDTASDGADESDEDPDSESSARGRSGAADGSHPTSIGAKAPRRTDRADRDNGTDSGEQRREQLASAVNNFLAPVYAPSSLFGAGRTETGSQQRRARTGRLTDADVDAALDHYVRPAPFEKALHALQQDRVIVLVGPSGIGKATSAIALLREVTDEPLAVLAPTVKIADLAEREFNRGLGHVVMDWQHDRSAADITDFTWRTLRDQVYDRSTHLVITTASSRSRGTTSVRHVNWEPPAIGDQLASHLSGTDLDAGEFVDRVPGDCTIEPIVAFARRLIAGDDLADALEDLGNDAAERVQQWFAAERQLTEILEVIALAFSTGRSERSFEAMLEGLTKAVTNAGYLLDTETTNRRHKSQAPRELRPVRADRNRADGITSRETIVVEGARRNVVKFRADSYRYEVLAQGWHSYEGRFWDAVRNWLEVVVTDSAMERNADTHMAVAAGLATLALVDMGEVEESYLYPWADGHVGWPGQLVATYVLWWMCFDDDLAPVALRIATRWATAGGPVLRWTAAIAFSGELGIRYPTEATNRLWHLSIQSKDSSDAIAALGQLFATLTAGNQNASQVLTLLDRRLDDVSQGRRDLRQQALIMLLTITVLSVRDARSGLPSITLFLEANPDRRALVARLWSRVLRHRPMRRLALAALIEAASAFDHAGERPEENARALGEALADVLRPGEHEQLATDFINHQVHAKRKRQDAAGIMRALLAALERLNKNNGKPGDPE